MSQPAKKDKGFTAEEREAMKERAKELKADANPATPSNYSVVGRK